MTVSTSQIRVNYTGDGVTQNFPIPFPFYLATDLLVILAGTSITVGYSVSGGNGTTGTLMMATPPMAAQILQIILNVPLTQLTNLVDGTAFPSATINQVNDRAIQASLRLQDQVSRSVRAPDGDTSPGLLLPSASARASMYLAFDANGNILPTAALPGTANTQASLGPILNPQTVAEGYAGVTPSSYLYPAGGVGGVTLDVRRFMNSAQISSAAAMDGLIDHTSAIQAANDFLEGRSLSGIGGSPHPGGRLYFPAGLYNISSTVRVGGHVEWCGEQYYSTVLNVNSSTLSGTLIKLGPDNSGFFGYNGLYSFGSGIRNMRISLQPNNQISVVILSVGAAQFSFLENVEIDNVNQYAIDLTGPGGPAYFSARQIQISGGTTDGLPTDREGFRISTGGGFVTLNEIAIEGAVGHNFNIGIRSSNDSGNGSQLLIHNIHTEQVTDGLFFDIGGTNATSLIQGWSGNSSCTNLIHIPTGYTGTVTAIAINGLTGSAGAPIAIKNDAIGESYANFMSGVYSWSGVPGVQTGSFAASILHNTPHIRYGKSATQAIAQNTLTLLTYPTKVDDWQTGGVSEWSGSRYTPKIPGRYRVSVSISMASTAWTAGQNLEIALLKNGSTFSINSDPSAVGTFTRQIMLTDTVFLNGIGDYIEAWVFQAAAASLNTDSNTFDCFIAIDRE